MFALLFIFITTVIAYEDPERYMNVEERIRYWKYPVEVHKVTTKDGYHLDVQRIPQGRDERSIPTCGKKRPPILLMHGLFSSGAQFVLNPPATNMAFIFADAGFDVWIGNVRGTEYGRNHDSLDVLDAAFWNFTWYDFAHYDLKDTVEYILDRTKEDGLFYVGHSQGTTVMFARLAEADLAWQKKIRAFFALAPNAGSLHPLGPLNLLRIPFLESILQWLTQHVQSFGIGLPRFLSTLLGSVCGHPLLGQACLTIGSISFESREQINETRIPVYLEPFPSMTSTLNLLHWAQIYKYKNMHLIDRGRDWNLKAYGSEIPPALNISNIHAPTEIFYSYDDTLTGAADVNDVILKNIGPGLRKVYEYHHFTHVDYAIGMLAPDEIYHPIVQTIYNDIRREGC